MDFSAQVRKDSIQVDLQNLKAQNAYRFCREVEPEGLSEVRVTKENGSKQSAVLFCGNDYLGLSQDARMKQAAKAVVDQYGTGAGASRLVSGTSPLCVALEDAVAQFKNTESALVFNSGYQANVGILSAILRESDWALSDKLNHASLVDGCLLAQSLNKANWTRYAHLDLDHLESRLKQIQVKRKPKSAVWIITDSVFSMDGDIADLKNLVALAKQYDAFTYVDEAHATGLYGDLRSSGQCESQGVSQEITLQMGTFSKALGSSGAYVASETFWRDWLVNHARSLIYSTALPPSVLAANLKALEIVQHDEGPKNKLWGNIHSTQRILEKLFAEHTDRAASLALNSKRLSPILPWVLGNTEETMILSQQLLAQGYFVQGIRPPTVPEGSARLRVTFAAHHTEMQIEGLFQALHAFSKR